MILREEMRRTLVSFQYFSKGWMARGSSSYMVSHSIKSNDPCFLEGLAAYANHQSHTFSSLHRRFDSIWNGLEKEDNPITEPVSVTSEETLLELQGGDV